MRFCSLIASAVALALASAPSHATTRKPLVLSSTGQVQQIQTADKLDSTTLATVPVAQGGTGSSDASGARSNLSAAKSGANSDITSITGLTTALSAPQGGTGQTTYAVGDLLYAPTTTTVGKLADVAIGNALISGGVGVAPSYGKIGISTHVSGLGTGIATALSATPTGSGSVALSAAPTFTGQVNITGSVDILKLTGSGNAWVGMSARNNYSSASAAAGAYWNANNENDLPIGGLSVTGATDGSSSLLLSYTPSGSRTADRRADGIHVSGAGTVTIGGAGGNLGTGQGVQIIMNQSPAAFITTAHGAGAVSGNWFSSFYYNGTSIGQVAQNGTTGVTYSTTSDRRRKTNIADAGDAGALIDSIRVRQFDWKSDGTHQRFGFIAQELYDVLPRAVTHLPGDDGVNATQSSWAVDASQPELIGALIKEVQTLRARVKALEMAVSPQAANDNGRTNLLLSSAPQLSFADVPEIQGRVWRDPMPTYAAGR